MADDDDQGYRWETEYEKTWEVLREDDDGSIQASVDHIVHQAKRRRLLERPANVRLGMMRHIFLIIDFSQAMEDQDLRPNRLVSSLKLLEGFVEEYFDQNPISQMGIIITKNKRAEKVAELGGNPKRHIKTLQQLKEKTIQGEPSLQNSLELAAQTLKHMPGHTSREVLIIFGSLTSCDPGDIHQTIQSMKKQNIRCNVIGLAADVYVCKKICNDTEGTYTVIQNEPNFKELLRQHVAPPPATGNTEASLIKMGFPHHQLQVGEGRDDNPSMCMCHMDNKVNAGFGASGFFCPQCKSKYCELPVDCKGCSLTLVSAPHLARSYRHLFPQQPFEEVPIDMVLQHSKNCYSCLKQLGEPCAYQCGQCKHLFCIDCDLYVHEILHSCPGCASSRQTQVST